MSAYQPRGPAFAYPSAVSDVTEPLSPVPWDAARVARLGRVLPFDGGRKQPRRGTVMAGVIEVTFDLSAFQVPTADAHRHFYVEPYLYVVTREPAALRDYVYDPVPGAVENGGRQLLRARDSALYSLVLDGEAATFTFAADVALEVATLVGRVEADRWYWSECDAVWG